MKVEAGDSGRDPEMLMLTEPEGTEYLRTGWASARGGLSQPFEAQKGSVCDPDLTATAPDSWLHRMHSICLLAQCFQVQHAGEACASEDLSNFSISLSASRLIHAVTLKFLLKKKLALTLYPVFTYSTHKKQGLQLGTDPTSLDSRV